MTIGDLVPLAGAKLAELKTALIFPAIERWIPKGLDDDLAQYHRGDWPQEIFNHQQLLRLELLQACRPQHSFRQTLREIWQAWRFSNGVAGGLPQGMPGSAHACEVSSGTKACPGRPKRDSQRSITHAARAR